MNMLIRANALSHCKITPRPLSCYVTPVVNLSDPILLYKHPKTLPTLNCEWRCSKICVKQMWNEKPRGNGRKMLQEHLPFHRQRTFKLLNQLRFTYKTYICCLSVRHRFALSGNNHRWHMQHPRNAKFHYVNSNFVSFCLHKPMAGDNAKSMKNEDICMSKHNSLFSPDMRINKGWSPFTVCLKRHIKKCCFMLLQLYGCLHFIYSKAITHSYYKYKTHTKYFLKCF